MHMWSINLTVCVQMLVQRVKSSSFKAPMFPTWHLIMNECLNCKQIWLPHTWEAFKSSIWHPLEKIWKECLCTGCTSFWDICSLLIFFPNQICHLYNINFLLGRLSLPVMIHIVVNVFTINKALDSMFIWYPNVIFNHSKALFYALIWTSGVGVLRVRYFSSFGSLLDKILVECGHTFDVCLLVSMMTNTVNSQYVANKNAGYRSDRSDQN